MEATVVAVVSFIFKKKSLLLFEKNNFTYFYIIEAITNSLQHLVPKTKNCSK